MRPLNRVRRRCRDPEHGLPDNFGEGLGARVLFWIAVAFASFQVVTAFGVPLDKPLLARITAMHLMDAAFAGWALWLVISLVRGQVRLDGWLAFGTMLVALILVQRFNGSLPNQVIRTLHVAFSVPCRRGMLAIHRSGHAWERSLWWIIAGLVSVSGCITGISTKSW